MDGSCRFVFVFYLCRLATIDLEENPLARAPSAGPRQKSSLGVIFGDGDGGDDDDGETDTNKSLEAIICPSQSFGCLCLPLSTLPADNWIVWRWRNCSIIRAPASWTGRNNQAVGPRNQLVFVAV